MKHSRIARLKIAAWLVQRLCHKDGAPCDGPRFRDGIFALRKALGTYEPKKGGPHVPSQLDKKVGGAA